MTGITMYSHTSVDKVEEESATGKQMHFYKCLDCGLRCLMSDPEKMQNIDCDAYQRGTA